MTHVRTVSLRVLSSRRFERRLRICRLRPRRLFATCRFRHSFPLRRSLVTCSLGSDLDFEQGVRYRPDYAESLSFALVNAFPEIEIEALKPLPINIENIADDPSLNNPLERLHRMGTGWFGVILDFEGVVVQSALKEHMDAWIRLAQEENKPRPLLSALHRAAPMKAEQAISEVLCWGREPSYVRRLAMRKEEIFAELIQDTAFTPCDGLYRLLETLNQQDIPVAVCSTERHRVEASVSSLGLRHYIDEIVTAEDVERCVPDPEAYAYAAQKLNRPPFRCVVVGASNSSCEAAHDLGMKCVATAGTLPPYELNAADLVVRRLDDLSFVNLKQLFREEELRCSEENEEHHDSAPSLF